MENLSFLFEYINLVTMGICLCIGYALKTAKVFERFGNQYIPLVMMALGLVISIVANIGDINQVTILGGMISGLASTGFYEMLRNLIEKDK